MHTHLHICHPRVGLSTVAIVVGRERGGRQIVGGNAPRVPVGPVDAICLDVDVHGVDAHVSIALEDLLVAPVRYGRVQAADFIVIGDIQKLSLSYGDIKKQQKNNNNIVAEPKTQPGRTAASQRSELTIGLAGLVDFGEVFVAAALVGSFGVVAHVGTHSKLLTLVLICEIKQPGLQAAFTSTVRSGTTAPSHLLRPLDRKPLLQEQKESVPFTTQ